MVYLMSSESCDCRTCNGGTPAPPGNFGGSSCLCPCHTLSGKDKEQYIKEKEKARSRLYDSVEKTKIPRVRAKDSNIKNLKKIKKILRIRKNK